MRNATKSLLFAVVFILSGAQVRAQQGPAETLQGMLAVQICTQSFTCEKPLGAKRNAKLSRPDRDVWVLKRRGRHA